MNTLQINAMLSDVSCFRGAFPRDMIPKPINRNFAFILNTDTSHSKGEHWIAIFVDENKSGIYFDPFGLPPLHGNIVRYLNETCTNGWQYNGVTLQNAMTETCGLHCVLFTKVMCGSRSLSDLQNLYTKNTLFNDILVNFYTE